MTDSAQQAENLKMVFESYYSAYNFWLINKDNIDKNYVMQISSTMPYTVDCRLIDSKREIEKTDLGFKSKAAHYNQSLDGVLNPVDGKRYDTKANYYKAINDAGSHIIEAGEATPDKRRELVGDFSCRKELTQATREVLSRRT